MNISENVIATEVDRLSVEREPGVMPQLIAHVKGAKNMGVTIAVPEGVKHWHGAAADSWMQHLTYHADAKPGNSNEWLEPVSDAVYGKLR